MPQRHSTKETLIHLRDVSWQRIIDSEKAVERQFHEGRLMLSLAVGFMLVGFLLVAQWRGMVSYGAEFDRESDEDMALVIQEITDENGALRDEVIALEMRVVEARRESESESAVLNEAAKELNGLRVVAGVEGAVGPGVTVTVSDPDKVLLPEDFVAIVHELRAGGAEAIAVNGRRVSARSGFSGADGRVELDGSPLARDYYIVALGSPEDLEQSLTLPGGIETALEAFPGVEVDIEQDESLEVAAGEEGLFRVGQPVDRE